MHDNYCSSRRSASSARRISRSGSRGLCSGNCHDVRHNSSYNFCHPLRQSRRYRRSQRIRQLGRGTSETRTQIRNFAHRNRAHDQLRHMGTAADDTEIFRHKGRQTGKARHSYIHIFRSSCRGRRIFYRLALPQILHCRRDSIIKSRFRTMSFRICSRLRIFRIYCSESSLSCS